MTGRMLIAGVGNIFLGDDGFGVEVATRLSSESLPDWVRVADYGISGMHLAYDLAEGFETTVLVDATPRGGEPGTLYVMELEAGAGVGAETDATPAEGRGIPLLDGHGMQPDLVFGMLKMLGADAGRVLLVGCEPASIDEGIGLSPPVAAAVDQAVRILLDLVRAEVGTGAEPPAGKSQPAPPARESHPAPAGGEPAGPTRTGSQPTLAASQPPSAAG